LNYIVKSENAQYYECGYSCDNAIFLRLGSEKYFITDGRYTTDAKNLIKSDTLVIEHSNILQKCKDIIDSSSIKKITFDPKEFSQYEYNILTHKLNRINFKASSDFQRIKRAIKSDDEIKLLKKAVKIGKKAFKTFVTDYLKEDKSEEELNFWLKASLSNFGKYDLSFEPILAFNDNTSKPHATATKKPLKSGDLVLIDAGVKYKRYCSDRTRTFNFNENFNIKLKQSFSNSKLQKIYYTVLKSHDKVIRKIRAGMKANQIDKIARDVIDDAGFGKFFIHSTGHGVGLDIHEYPFISNKSSMVIEENMVFTIEPGIYIPNEFGVRIEDMVVIKNGRAEVL
jgi:Xaa-Pro aminopeptidase